MLFKTHMSIFHTDAKYLLWRLGACVQDDILLDYATGSPFTSSKLHTFLFAGVVAFASKCNWELRSPLLVIFFAQRSLHIYSTALWSSLHQHSIKDPGTRSMHDVL
jgi:hypothetical protein